MPTIHNHTVDGDEDALHAFRQLDEQEAKVLLEYAKHHREADFETTIHAKRMNFKLIRESDGTYKVENEGKEAASSGGKSGWF